MSQGFMFTAYTYSPLHAGVGQQMGAVDLPIEREKHTNYPCVFATGVKGALRAHISKPLLKLKRQLKVLEAENSSEELIQAKKAEMKPHEDFINGVFGPEGAAGGGGGAIFTDLKLLLFPVRSSQGAFKWVTSERIIERFSRDYKYTFPNKTTPLSVNNFKTVTMVEQLPDSIDDLLILEDFICGVNSATEVTSVLEKLISPAKKNDIYLVKDEEIFKFIVTNATQVIARNQLNDKKVSGNLWYEEFIPADALLYSFIKPTLAYDDKSEALNGFEKKFDGNGFVLQIGGGETVGNGITQIKKIGG